VVPLEILYVGEFSMFRVCAQILTLDGHAVQSIRFKDIIPLGKLNPVVKCINELMPDEIHIQAIDGKISEVLKELSSVMKHINLPLSVGGGVRSLINVRGSMDYAERYIFNSDIFLSEKLESKDVRQKYGLQSCIGYLPFRFDNQLRTFIFFNSDTQSFNSVDVNLLSTIFNSFSEVVLLDADAQGLASGFNMDILKSFEGNHYSRIYVSGGIDAYTIAKSKEIGLAGVVLDNSSLFFSDRVYLR